MAGWTQLALWLHQVNEDSFPSHVDTQCVRQGAEWRVEDVYKVVIIIRAMAVVLKV